LRTRAFIPFAVLLLWWATRVELNLWGFAVAGIGELLRLWASGYLHKGGKTVTTGGPYAFCRNPLYLGTTLMGVGFALTVNYWLAAGVAALMLVFHFITIKHEESRLAERYGEPFSEYLANVPRLFPRLIPWQGGQGNFSFARLRANKELLRAVFGLIFLAALLLLAYLCGPEGI
jgi:protein-S-isoprenylcysteine O-methyltransferase Ste14